MRMTLMQRVALVLIVVGAIASLAVAADRFRFEAANRTVEVTMDQQDLADFAHAFGYKMDELLRQMRRNGLTSVAVYEETGQRINLGDHAYALTGQQLIDQARTAPISNPTLAGLMARRAVDPNSVYLLVFDAPTLDRYLFALRNQLEPRNVRIIREKLPAVLAVRTQIDFFNSLGLGVPADVAAAVRREGLLVDPRVQNNERLDAAGIDRVFRQMLQGGRIGTVIFFGQRNEVLGYQYNLNGTADAFKKYQVNFGDIEAYDPSQIQKGTETLGRIIPSQTARVQAIAKLELDKLTLDTVVARYLLGVRERNIRVIYLRPFPHVVQDQLPDGTLVSESAEQTNLKMLRELRDGLEANGYRLGRAGTFVDFKGAKLDVLYMLAALGCTAAFFFLLGLYGWERKWLSVAAYAATLLVFVAALATGHDQLVRRLWALGGALTFGVLAGTTLARWFARDAEPAGDFGGDLKRGVVCLCIAAAVALLGGVFVTGLLSQADFMLELNQFLGVKLLLVVPPVVTVALYAFTPKFGRATSLAQTADAALKAWQFAALVVLGGAAALLLMRSGNQPDIGVSGFETHVRGALTQIFGARPRFKDFVIGFPALMLIPALMPAHKRVIGWLFVLAGGIGLADILDTFSHVHTPLAVDLLRVLNGLVLGIIIGAVLQAIYRAMFRSAAAPVSPVPPH